MAMMDRESRPDKEPRGRRMTLHPKIRLRLAAQNIRPPIIDETLEDGSFKLCDRDTQSSWRTLLNSTILEEDDSSDAGF